MAKGAVGKALRKVFRRAVFLFAVLLPIGIFADDPPEPPAINTNPWLWLVPGGGQFALGQTGCGVFYLSSTLGLCGWVRNRRDGSVEAVFSGEAPSVEAMLAACLSGPRLAMVEEVRVTERMPESIAALNAALGTSLATGPPLNQIQGERSYRRAELATVLAGQRRTYDAALERLLGLRNLSG